MAGALSASFTLYGRSALNSTANRINTRICAHAYDNSVRSWFMTKFLLFCSLKDDEQISTALGYIVHILLLTSKYLQVSYDLVCTYLQYLHDHTTSVFDYWNFTWFNLFHLFLDRFH